MRFRHLDVPDQWQHYWSKYPNGYTILEALLAWVAQVDSMVDNVNTWNDYLEDFVENFDKKLEPTVRAMLDEMAADGRLAQIINGEIFGELNTKVTRLENWTKGEAIDITLSPYNAVADTLYRDDLTGKWYKDAGLTQPSTPMGDIINQAIQDSKATNRHIKAPSGFYYLDKPIKIIPGLRLSGGGMHYQEEFGTVFRLDGDYHGLSTDLLESDVTDMRSVLLEDFMVKGNAMAPAAARTNYGLNAVHMRYNVQVNRVGFKYFKYGMYLNNVWKATFNDVLTNYNLIGTWLDSQCNRVTFNECEFNRNTESAVRISPYGMKAESVLFQGCLIEKNDGHGIRLANVEAVTIDDCYIEGNHWNSILIDPIGDDFNTEVGSVRIIGNRMFGNSNYSYANNAIYIGDGGVKNVKITGNHMRFFKDAVIRMYLHPEMQTEIEQNTWSDTPNYISYLNDVGNKPIVKQAGYLNLNGNKLRGAVIESFYNANLPTTDVYDGRIAYDLTNKCLTIYSEGAWKKIPFAV